MQTNHYDPPAPPPEHPAAAPYVPANPFDHEADRHLRHVSPGGAVGACASIWFRETPPIEGERTGVIGHYWAENAESGIGVLNAACEALKRRGATVAIGPMDGTTWRRYRFVTRRGDRPRFFLEPDQPDAWPGHFRDAGFTPLARYTSALLTDLDRPDPRLAGARDRADRAGVRIREFDTTDFTGELRRIYAVSRASFKQNFLFTPLAEEAFFELYRPLQPLIRPETVLVAEEGDRAVGFAFALPDLCEKERTGRTRTLVLKTLAVLPGRTYAGIGTLLAGEIRRRAAGLGFDRLIHALMHEDNNSKNLGKQGAVPIREYTLYRRRLGRTDEP